MKKRFKSAIAFSLSFVPCLGIAEMPEARFVSAVQWAVHEPSPELVRRSQALVLEEFSNSIDMWPELHGRPYDIQTNGNEIVFSMSSDSDMRESIQNVVTAMISHLNGRVRSRGRSNFYRTSLVENDNEGLLQVVGDSEKKRIRAIVAQSVPLRDLLKEIKFRLQGAVISYLIPVDCLNRVVDWDYGSLDANHPGKDADTIMGELATAFDLSFEKRNGTYIFKNTCSHHPAMRSIPRGEVIRTSLNPGRPPSQSPHLLVPWMPVGD